MDFKRNDRVIYSGDRYIIVDILYDIEVCTIIPCTTTNDINPIIKVVNMIDLELDNKYYREEKIKTLLDG